MINTISLKNKILSLAFEGKLTKREELDDDVNDLIDECRKEKEVLFSQGIIKDKIEIKTEKKEPYKIPNEWKWVFWGDLSYSIQYGCSGGLKEKGNVKLVRISDIQDNRINWNLVPYSNIDEKEINQYKLNENDILFARTGGTVGKSVIVKDIPLDTNIYVFAGYLIRSNYCKKINPKYLKYFMESSLYWRQLKNETIGSAQPNCNAKTLSELLIPLPSSSEQNRIVCKIDSCFELIDNIEKKQNSIEYDLNNLKTKIVDNYIFQSRDIGVPKNYKTLSDITNENTLNDGNWILSSDMSEDGNVKLIQLGNIGDNRFIETNYKHITIDRFNELNCRQIYPGYLLINRLVSDMMLSCIIPDIDGTLITSVDACWIAPNENVYNLKYIMYMLSSSYFQNKVKLKGKGVTRFRISKTNLISIPFPLPEKERQDEIADKIENAFKLIEEIGN